MSKISISLYKSESKRQNIALWQTQSCHHQYFQLPLLQEHIGCECSKKFTTPIFDCYSGMSDPSQHLINIRTRWWSMLGMTHLVPDLPLQIERSSLWLVLLFSSMVDPQFRVSHQLVPLIVLLSPEVPPPPLSRWDPLTVSRHTLATSKVSWQKYTTTARMSLLSHSSAGYGSPTHCTNIWWSTTLPVGVRPCTELNHTSSWRRA